MFSLNLRSSPERTQCSVLVCWPILTALVTGWMDFLVFMLKNPHLLVHGQLRNVIQVCVVCCRSHVARSYAQHYSTSVLLNYTFMFWNKSSKHGRSDFGMYANKGSHIFTYIFLACMQRPTCVLKPPFP